MSRPSPARLLIAAVAIISFFIFIDTPYTGDDLGYKAIFQGASPRYDSWWSYPRWVVSHWLNTNGRIPNDIMPLLFSLPKGLVALACAAVLMLMYRMALALSMPGKKGFWPVALTAAIFFVLPWWDSMFVFACQLNYVWASAFSLLAVWIIFSVKSGSRWFTLVSALVCGAGAMMHEAASLPLLVGLGFYILYARWRPDRVQKIMLMAFAVGTALVTLSPGIIMRAGENVAADDPLPVLLLKTDIVAAALWVVIVWKYFSKKDREKVVALMRSRLGIFAVASLVSMVISLASGIVGRSGWFAEMYALMVIFGWLSRRWQAKVRWASPLLCCLVLGQLVGVAIWQHRLSNEFDVFIEDYVASDDGMVYQDYTRDGQLPWWALGRLRGVLDPDDAWLLSTHAAYYREDAPWPVVVPIEAADHIPLDNEEYELLNGDLLTRELPYETEDILLERERQTIKLCEIDGRQWVAQAIPAGGWHLSPRQLDLGDR